MFAHPHDAIALHDELVKKIIRMRNLRSLSMEITIDKWSVKRLDKWFTLLGALRVEG